MPQKKTKTNHPVKKRNVVLVVALVVFSMIVLGVIGKFILRDIARQQELERQKTVLNQTLSDMTALYQRFKSSNATLATEDSPPENRCSEISSKGTAKLYTCGTRASLVYSGSNETDFRSMSEALWQSVTDGFGTVKVYDVKQDSVYDALTMQVTLEHRKSGQVCYIFGDYYRQKERYTAEPNEIQFSFNCNLNTDSPIFKLED